MDYPKRLKKEGYAEQEPVKYAEGKLALFTARKDISLKKGVSVALDQNVQRISIADPALAPYGKAAIEAFANSGILKDVQQKFITTATVADVVAQTINGADIGCTALSMRYSPAVAAYDTMPDNWIEVDASLYSPIEQGMVILSHGKNNAAVKSLYNFILSSEGKKIFLKNGYN
jgi:molybdate transport system substrate-binding protein